MLALALTHLLHAQPAGLDLRWEAPAGCPDGEAVAAMVSRFVREVDGATEPTTVRAKVVRSRSGWELRLTLESGRGRYARKVRSDDCPALARTTALVAAIDLDPLAVTRTFDATVPEREASPPPEVMPVNNAGIVPPAPASAPREGTVELTEGTASQVTPREEFVELPEAGDVGWRGAGSSDELSEGTALQVAPRLRPAGHVRVEGGIEAGLLPGVGGQAGVFGGVSFSYVRVEAGLVGLPLRVEPAQAGRAGGRFDRLVAALRICPQWQPRPWVALALCAGFEAGAIRGQGLDVVAPNPVWAPSLGVSLGPAARLRVAGPLGVWLGLDGELAVWRPRFSAREEQVFQVGRGGVRASVGLELQFGRRKR